MLRTRKSTEGSTRKRLGRGLESLISKPVPIEVTGNESNAGRAERGGGTATASQAQHVEPKPAPRTMEQHAQPNASLDSPLLVSLSVSSIIPNRRQPRQSMDEASLEALAQSIRQAGLMQPIVVRPAGKAGNEFELVAGERRWRAAQRIGLANIPAIVRDVDDRTAAELALVENIQREDLNPIDRAEAFERLINDFDLTHQQLAERVGLDRSTITNFTRLTTLDEYSREMVRTNKLSLGHAKVLLAITNNKTRSDLALRAVRQGMSVRALEREIEHLRDSSSGDAALKKQGKAPLPHLADLQQRLAEHLGTKVRIRPGAKKGTGAVTIEFYSLDQFDGLMERLGFATSDTSGG